MANTFAQIHIQVVFTVEGRQSLIAAEHSTALSERFEVEYDQRCLFKPIDT